MRIYSAAVAVAGAAAAGRYSTWQHVVRKKITDDGLICLLNRRLSVRPGFNADCAINRFTVAALNSMPAAAPVLPWQRFLGNSNVCK